MPTNVLGFGCPTALRDARRVGFAPCPVFAHRVGRGFCCILTMI